MLKVFFWICLLGFLFAGLNFIVQPVVLDWHTYDTVKGFYAEPKDTIEVLFLGPSGSAASIIPMELYEDYGICAYNLGTPMQPMMASYYWLQEAYRKHPQTLKTVVLEGGVLRYPLDLSPYHRAIDGMQFSSVKYHAVRDYSSKMGDTMANLLPIYVYHDRWKELNQTDFEKINYSANVCDRGYYFVTERYLDSGNILPMPLYFADDDETGITLDSETVYYFEQIVNFCDVHDLDIVLVRLGQTWESSVHNAVKSMAEDYGVEFLDFSFEPLFSEIAFNRVTDSADIEHPNYYGAKKITAYMGNYLKTHYQFRDVREDTKYSFMKEQLNQYHTSVGDVIKRNEIIDPAEYLSLAVADKDVAVFIAVKDDAASQLNAEQRANFAAMGLSKLSALAFRDSYLAVFDRGKLICEQIEHQGSAEEDRELVTLSYSGKLGDGSVYSLESGGIAMGNKASCLIDGTEYAQNQRGLNIVIYDNKTKKVIDSTFFDTCASAVREGGDLTAALNRAEQSGKSYDELSAELQKFYLYNRRCDNKRTAGYLKQNIDESGLFTYLSAYWKEDYIIYLSVMDEAAGAMDEAARACLADYGLEELSELGYRDSYLGVVNGGQVVYERKDHGSEPIATRYISHVLKSGGNEARYCHSSIIIDGTEYSPNARGINIVVYDTMTKEVVDTAVFDTCVNPIKTLNTEDK